MINVAPGGSEGRSWRTWPPVAMADKAEPCMGLLKIHTKAERRRPLVFWLTHMHTLLLSSSTMSKHLHIVGYQMCIPAVITGVPSVYASRRTPSTTDISGQRAHSRHRHASANAANSFFFFLCFKSASCCGIASQAGAGCSGTRRNALCFCGASRLRFFLWKFKAP